MSDDFIKKLCKLNLVDENSLSYKKNLQIQRRSLQHASCILKGLNQRVKARMQEKLPQIF